MADKIFKRKIYNKMLAWKKDFAGKTALLIEGARRIGKSTITEEFARNEYENYLIIDFANAPRTVMTFSMTFQICNTSSYPCNRLPA